MRDTDVQIEGPAVAEFQKLFLDTWQKQKGPKLSDRNYFPDLKEEGNALVRVVGSTPGQSNRITFVVYVSAITFAEHSIHLTNAYFIPDDQILDAFTDAARRGVDVKIILPSTSDSSMALDAMRYNYSELLKAGVKVYEYRNAWLHAKTAVIDGVWSTVGSTNLDYLSLSSIDEVNAVILSREFAIEMEKMFARDLAEVRPGSMGRVAKKTRVPKGKGVVCTLVFPLDVTLPRPGTVFSNGLQPSVYKHELGGTLCGKTNSRA